MIRHAPVNGPHDTHPTNALGILRNQISQPINIVHIGAGEIFNKRYIDAYRELQKENIINLVNVYDIKCYDDVESNIDIEDIYMNISDIKDIDKTMEYYSEYKNIRFIIATPPTNHRFYIDLLLQKNFIIGVEKPISANEKDILYFNSDNFKNLYSDKIFLFQYYALEKAFPLVYFRYFGLLSCVQKELVSRDNEFDALELSGSLGKLESINAIIIEGVDDRSWINENESGGQTLETFSHLLSISCLIGGDLKLIDYRMGRSEDLPDNMSETVMFGEYSTADGVKVRLGCAKWQPKHMQQRWARLKYENGEAFMNFDTETLTIKTGRLILDVHMKFSTKYVPQMIQFIDFKVSEFYRILFDSSLHSTRLAIESRQYANSNSDFLQKNNFDESFRLVKSIIYSD